jgi:hypothetical protein
MVLESPLNEAHNSPDLPARSQQPRTAGSVIRQTIMKEETQMVRKLVSLMVLSLAMSLALVAADSQFTGTWKLNVAKSKFSPGPAPKSQTVTIQQDGKVTVTGVDATGQPISWSYTANGDGPATITGLPNSSVIVNRIDDRNRENTWKMNGGSSTGHAAIAKNGKTMKYTLKGTDAKGETVHDVEIYERQ